MNPIKAQAVHLNISYISSLLTEQFPCVSLFPPVNFRVPSCTKYNPYDPLSHQPGIMIIGKSGLSPSLCQRGATTSQLHKSLIEIAPLALGPKPSAWALNRSRNGGRGSSPCCPYFIL